MPSPRRPRRLWDARTASGIPSESTSAGDLGDPDAHNGVTGLSRVPIDHLVANYYHTEEAKEMGRAFNSKQDPDPDKFYR